MWKSHKSRGIYIEKETCKAHIRHIFHSQTEHKKFCVRLEWTDDEEPRRFKREIAAEGRRSFRGRKAPPRRSAGAEKEEKRSDRD